MKYKYAAIFTPESKGGYSITFPDVKEAITCGSNIEEAIEMAKECLYLALSTRELEGNKIPKPDMDNLNCPEGSFISIIEFNSRSLESKTVRKNITIPAWLDIEARKKKINFSNVLKNALLEELGEK